MKPGVHSKQDRLQALVGNVKRMSGRAVLVGIPREQNERGEDGVTNSDIGYWMEFGAPEANVPARPSLVPGIRDARKQINERLAAGAKAMITARKTNNASVEKHLMAAGQVAVNSIQSKIRAGIPPPLAESTLRRRARRKKGSGHRINKGAIQELRSRAAGNAAGVQFAKPLIDSGQFLKSFTYVLRKS